MTDKECLVFTLPDGRAIQVITRGTFEATYVALGDDLMLTVFEKDNGYDVGLKQAISKSPRGAMTLGQVSVDIVTIKAEDFQSAKVKGAQEPLRTCSVCNGQTYCVTNGCVNIGCGWLCD